MRLILSLLLLTLITTSPARAQDMNTLLDIPEGATLISLSATERVEVDQDLLSATLSYEAEDTVAANLQEEINTVMKKAIAEAKKFDTVKVSTQSYQVYPYDYNPVPNSNDPSKIIHKWRGSQSLMLKSKTPDDLLAVVGKMQEMGMNMNSLFYSVSPELMEETQNGLLEAALTKLKAKGERTAKALGKTKSDLLTVNVDVGGYAPQPMARGGVMMMKAEMAMDAAAPVAEAGQSDITLSVNAQALVK